MTPLAAGQVWLTNGPIIKIKAVSNDTVTYSTEKAPDATFSRSVAQFNAWIERVNPVLQP